MSVQNTIAIFDIGKTNKKFFLINEQYRIVLEENIQLDEITDEDGENCEDVKALTDWVLNTFRKALQSKDYAITAINFSTYGASFVYIDEQGNVVTALYNYLKPFPAALNQQFYNDYGGAEKITKETASPALGSLNSALQLYRIKHEQPAVYQKIKYALHLPQYLNFLFTRKAIADITSIGCHTHLWNFEQHQYHNWVKEENIIEKMPELFSSADTMNAVFENKPLKTGSGLHDSSAALIPYLTNFSEPFILISTGTWCISFNPFNNEPLQPEELKNDCLCYMGYNGNSVKASRLFAGYEHEGQTKRLAKHFNVAEDHYKTVAFDASLTDHTTLQQQTIIATGVNNSGFENIDLAIFASYEEAYHCFMQFIMRQQFVAAGYVMSDNIKRIFVDGGFSKNPVYMNLLAGIFPGKEIFAASVSQATAMGAALAIHRHWNSKPIPADIVEMKLYAAPQKLAMQ